MVFDSPLLPGILVKRSKRFLAEILLDSGETIMAHCPNSGSMKGVNVPGAPVLVSHRPNPKRWLQYTWQMIHLEGDWVGINTMVPNRVAAEAFESGTIPAFRRYREYRSEVVIAEGTRIDFVLGSRKPCYVEVKNVSLVEDGVAKFPDSVTERGSKHLRHLIAHAKRGGKSAMLYVVQHHAARSFTVADEIDPVYGQTLRKAAKVGVKIEVWQADVSPKRIHLARRMSYFFL